MKGHSWDKTKGYPKDAILSHSAIPLWFKTLVGIGAKKCLKIPMKSAFFDPKSPWNRDTSSEFSAIFWAFCDNNLGARRNKAAARPDFVRAQDQ